MTNKKKVEFLGNSPAEKNPFKQFEKWYGEAYRLLGEEASAMTLATAWQHQPNARIVYLRGKDRKGFWFFTNYNSQKGKELEKNNRACAVFYWARTGKQVRIIGRVEKLSPKQSDAYFRTRPRGSQIGAWASPQSQIIEDRQVLEAWVAEFSRQFEGKPVPRPGYWGGYRLIPTEFEFWYHREHRLHDRLLYSRQPNNTWKIQRKAP